MNNINITLDDIKQFLQTIGYTWENEAFINSNWKTATDICDLDIHKEALTTLKLYQNGNPICSEVAINPISFTFYKQSFNHSDIDYTVNYVVEIDYSEQWIKFLLQTYGKDYRNYVNKLCRKMRNDAVNTAKYEFDKIKIIKKDLLNKLKVKLKYYQKLENIVNNKQEFTK